jgi:hypothetical protein
MLNIRACDHTSEAKAGVTQQHADSDLFIEFETFLDEVGSLIAYPEPGTPSVTIVAVAREIAYKARQEQVRAEATRTAAVVHIHAGVSHVESRRQRR